MTRGVQPLHINIPDASSPNKFLPTNPNLDTTNIFHAGGSSSVDASGFLQGLQTGTELSKLSFFSIYDGLIDFALFILF